MGRGRPTINIDRHQLESAIQVAEAAGPLANRSILWQGVVNALDAVGVKVSTAFVAQRVKLFGLDSVLKTPVGKRGRAGGNPNLGSGPRVTAAEKFSKSESIQHSLMLIEAEFGKKFPSKVKKLKKSNKAAGIQLKCIDCSGGSVSEAKACQIVSCPLWPLMKRKAPQLVQLTVPQNMVQ
jgi:hypothetical protein